MGYRIVLVGDQISILRSELGIHQGYGSIDRHRVAQVIGGVMRQRTQCKGVFIQILRVPNQRNHEVAASSVVKQVAEELASKRIVSHVLQDGAAVSVGAGVSELFFRGIRKAS